MRADGDGNNDQAGDADNDQSIHITFGNDTDTNTTFTATATDALHQSILRFNASDNANVHLEFQLHSTKTNIYKISGDSITSFLISLPEHSVHTMSSLHPTLAQTS